MNDCFNESCHEQTTRTDRFFALPPDEPNSDERREICQGNCPFGLYSSSEESVVVYETNAPVKNPGEPIGRRYVLSCEDVTE